RRLQDLQCAFQVDVISTSGRDPKALLKLETQSDASDDGATYLTEPQVTAFRDLVAQMANEGTAAVTGGLKLVLFNGQGAELKLRRRRLPTTGTAPLPALSIAPIIAADRSAIRLQLAVGASKPLDALARTQGYTIKKGQSLLLDMTDAHLRNNLARMVGAQSGAVRRLHKLDLFAGGEPGAADQPDKAALAERVLLLITPRIVELVEKVELVGVDLPAKSALSAIVIEGNKTIETKEILKLIKSQTGQPLDLKQVKEDVRSLISRRWFFHVETRVAESNDGPVLIFRVTEKPSQDQAP
ncbi:MAG TPA: POTRA domain-containing protein, partial [Planctomycetaceae bacterium]